MYIWYLGTYQCLIFFSLSALELCVTLSFVYHSSLIDIPHSGMHSTCCYILTAGKWDEGRALACCWCFSWYQGQSVQTFGTFECKISLAEGGRQFEYWLWQHVHGVCTTVASGKVKVWSWHLPSTAMGMLVRVSEDISFTSKPDGLRRMEVLSDLCFMSETKWENSLTCNFGK